MIAICFVVHNNLRYTQGFLESVARNSYPHSLGFFALDNGSSDGSLEYLNEMQVSPKVVLRNEGNESLSKGWSRVLQAALDAGAELLCLLNNDILVGPGWLDAILCEKAKPTKAYWLANGALKADNLDANVRSQPKTGRTYPGRAGWCLFFTPEAAREFLPIPEELRLWCGDDYIHWKLKNAGYAGLAVQDCYVHHFISKTVQIIQAKGSIQHIIDADKEAYFKITGERL